MSEKDIGPRIDKIFNESEDPAKGAFEETPLPEDERLLEEENPRLRAAKLKSKEQEKRLEEHGFHVKSYNAQYSNMHQGVCIFRPDGSRVFLNEGEIQAVLRGKKILDPDDRKEFDSWYQISAYRLNSRIESIFADIPDKKGPRDKFKVSTQYKGHPLYESVKNLEESASKIGYTFLGTGDNFFRNFMVLNISNKDMDVATTEQLDELHSLWHEVEDEKAMEKRKKAKLAYLYDETDSERIELLYQLDQDFHDGLSGG